MNRFNINLYARHQSLYDRQVLSYESERHKPVKYESVRQTPVHTFCKYSHKNQNAVSRTWKYILYAVLQLL